MEPNNHIPFYMGLFTCLLILLLPNIMNEFLKVRLRLTAALEKIDKIYRENQVMKRRLLKYEKPNALLQ